MDFRSFAALPDESLDLFTGALLIARDAYPSLDLETQRACIQELVTGYRDRPLAGLRVVEQAERLAEYLFGVCGFAGNEDDYYDPRNSFINEVLERRLGIPISLAIVYLEVAKLLGVQARGVGFPGHFLVRLDEPRAREAVMIDVFNGGVVLDRSSLERLFEKAVGQPKSFDLRLLAPTPPRQILARMLMNLRNIYATRGDYPRLLLVLDRLIDLLPEISSELRDRGLLCAKLGAPGAALDDLRRYVEKLPHAGDIGDVQRLIEKLERAESRVLN